MFRRVVFVVLAILTGLTFGGPPTAAAQGVADATAYTATVLQVREHGAPGAPVLGTLPRGTLVRVGACAARWCAVSTGALSGYAARQHLSPTPPYGASGSSTPTAYEGSGAALSGGRGYTNAAGLRVRSPAFTGDGRAPAGASAQCRDGSFSFSMSHRGTCSHHGGVARWL